MMKKKVQKLYCDTSVIGGIIDDEFSEYSKKFLSYVKAGFFNLILSPIVDNEINSEGTPEEVIKEYENLIKISEIVNVTQEAIELQKAYLKENILTPKWGDDALHVSFASVNNCDFIVSWNFKHIVNFQKIPLYNAVNKLNGYSEIQIFSPLELDIDNEE